MENNEIVVFLDNVCRTIAGVKVNDDGDTLSIKNPVIVNAVPNQDGQMSLQLIPVFFREILLDMNQDCVFDFNKSSITTTNISELNKQIEMQYAILFKPVPVAIDSETEDGSETVDLFGDDDLEK